MKITYYGQNALLIETGDHKILVDPFISENDLAKDKIDINDLQADFIFLTHAHYDHLGDTEAIAKNTGAVIVGGFEVFNYFDQKDLEAMPMNHGGKREFDFGTVKCVNAIHSSSFPDGSYGGNPLGFIFSDGKKNLYVSGDTALTMDMKLVPMFANIDLAVLPIGDVVTMGVEDAIIACDFIECDRVLGAHYDVFPFTEIDRDEVRQKFKTAGKNITLLDVGTSMEV